MNSARIGIVLAVGAILAAVPALHSPASAQTVGVWKDVTPAGIKLGAAFNNDNYGVQDVVVDPVRPMDAYAFTCHQGVWKSTDYGLTWNGPINTGTGGALLDGKQWTAVIDNDAGRDPQKPPTLWTANGNNAMGVLKSTDGGVSWTKHSTHNATGRPANDYGGEDAYSLDLDPYDNAHMLAGFHGAGLSESMDGGVTWRDIAVPADFGGSVYPFFIDTGDSAATRKTWFAEADLDENGSWSSLDAGATWKRVGAWGHPHGSAQLFNAGNGVAYVGGNKGVFRTTDKGATWSNVYAKCNGVIGTPSALYASYSFPAGPAYVLDPALAMAPRNPGTAWAPMAKPAGMSNGSKRASVTFDGIRHVILAGCWNAGLWRYVEPKAGDLGVVIAPLRGGASARDRIGLRDALGKFRGLSGLGAHALPGPASASDRNAIFFPYR